jgi:Fe-S cluster biogenesis protein NfuA
MTMLDKMRGIFASPPTGSEAIAAPMPSAAPPESDDASVSDDAPNSHDPSLLEIDIRPPADDVDTCKVELTVDVSPEGTLFFESYAEAEGWPLAQSLMRVPGVVSVITKGKLLIVAKHSGASWSDIVPRLDPAIRAGLAPSSDAVNPVDAIASAVSGSSDDLALRKRVQEILDDEINPQVAAHGGYISLLDVQGTRVFIQLGGGCQGCAMSAATLKHGVEATLKAHIPEITEILDTTDHAAGSNPFFQGADL